MGVFDTYMLRNGNGELGRAFSHLYTVRCLKEPSSWAHWKAAEIPSTCLSRIRARYFRRCSSSVNGSNASRVFMVCVQNQACGAVKWSNMPGCCRKHPGFISICFWVVYCDTHPQLCIGAVKSRRNAYVDRDELFQSELTARPVGLWFVSTSTYVADADDMTAFREGLKTWSSFLCFAFMLVSPFE